MKWCVWSLPQNIFLCTVFQKWRAWRAWVGCPFLSLLPPPRELRRFPVKWTRSSKEGRRAQVSALILRVAREEGEGLIIGPTKLRSLMTLIVITLTKICFTRATVFAAQKQHIQSVKMFHRRLFIQHLVCHSSFRSKSHLVNVSSYRVRTPGCVPAVRVLLPTGKCGMWHSVRAVGSNLCCAANTLPWIG